MNDQNVDIFNAIEIRLVEEKLLDLFSKGLLHGTVHTCIGQEFSAVSVAKYLFEDDFIFSNHRCHGHFIAKTNNIKGLIAEIMGLSSGVCGGLGGSQHLFSKGFFSNGIQGSIIPIAAGMAMNTPDNNIGVVFIGDGTFGQGILYESMNLMKLLKIPLLIVCEDNGISQSTLQFQNLAGRIRDRIQSFDINYYHASTNYVNELNLETKNAISFVRNSKQPAFLHIKTNRLKAHSKGDDTRDKKTIKELEDLDPINIFAKENEDIFAQYLKIISTNLNNIVDELLLEKQNSKVNLRNSVINKKRSINFESYDINYECRFVELYNKALIEITKENFNVLHIGEDILSPYGGAFKVTKNLSELFPERVISTPISEQAIVGLANGFALSGKRPIVEIMFGDFTTLIVDQIVNNAAKFRSMYNEQIICPIIVRSPMGGYRGYGPTHSQTLDKLFLGIDGLIVIALNVFIDLNNLLNQLIKSNDPILLIENKVDYTRYLPNNYKRTHQLYINNKSNFPILKFTPKVNNKNLTIVCYGGMISLVIDSCIDLFIEHEIFVEIICPSHINDLDISEIIESIKTTKNILFVDESTLLSSYSSNIASLLLKENLLFNYDIVCTESISIPSSQELELQALPSKHQIINKAKKVCQI
jgi:2-oxoisovalerate dehydrogenase E1 component